MFNDLIERMQNELIKDVMSDDYKAIIIHSVYDSGKSFLLQKMFNQSTYIPKLYQPGSEPKFRRFVANTLKYNVENIYFTYNTPIDLYIDELDDEYSLDIVFNDLFDKIHKVVLCTNCNIPEKYKKKCKNINLLDYYGDEIKKKCRVNGLSVGSLLNIDNSSDVQKVKDVYIQRLAVKKSSKHCMSIIICEDYKSINVLFNKF